MNVIDTRDGVTAYLTGGLGNQMFVWAAAYAQARRLDCPLYVDASRYARGDARALEITDLKLPGTLVIGDDSIWMRVPPHQNRWRDRIRLHRRSTVFLESGFDFDPRVDSVRPGTTLVGYFQSAKYFRAVEDDLYTLVTDNFLSEDPAHVITVHARRGDYLVPKYTSHHGIAGANYLKRAISSIRTLTGIESAVIYSDSPDVVRAELSYVPALLFDDSPAGEPASAVLRRMSLGSAMVMSNSSFSWWAAWMMTRRDPSAAIIAPRPWLASGEAALGLMEPTWMTLGV